jgi:hypothetical protein
MSDGIDKDRGAAPERTLEQRVTELYDRMEIQQLVIRYAHAIIEKNVDLVLSLFADEGAAVDFDLSAVVDGGHKTGLAELRKVYAGGMERLDPWPQLCNHLIEWHSPNHATGVVYIELRNGKMNHQVSLIGKYTDVYEKIDGVWKFRSRKTYVKHVPTLNV